MKDIIKTGICLMAMCITGIAVTAVTGLLTGATGWYILTRMFTDFALVAFFATIGTALIILLHIDI